MKRFLIILLIVFIVLNSVYVPKVYAVGNMIVNNPFNKQLIATMIIASGMVFTSTKQIEDTVTSFIDKWNDHETGWTMPTPKEPQGPNTWEAILYAAITGGSIVYDITTGTFKQLLELTEDFVDFVKQFVDDNYDEGENIIYPEGFWSKEYFMTPQIFPTKEYEYYYGYDNQGNKIGHYRWINEDELRLYGSGGASIRVWYNQTYTITAACWYDAPIKWLRVGQISGGDFQYLGIVFDKFEYFTIYNKDTYPSYHVFESIQGIEDIVDNPEYEYKHNETGTPTIVIPIQSPEPDESGYFVPSEDLDDLVEKIADDIANESTDGIIIPAPTPTPSPEPVPYPELPGEDIATEYDYDTPNKRALYQLKFPFSLPWDIKAVFQLLNAPAKAPYFEIDIIPAGLKDKIGITGETEFIFDMEDFELIGQVSRFFSFIGFCLTLIYITRFIIKS